MDRIVVCLLAIAGMLFYGGVIPTKQTIDYDSDAAAACAYSAMIRPTILSVQPQAPITKQTTQVALPPQLTSPAPAPMVPATPAPLPAKPPTPQPASATPRYDCSSGRCRLVVPTAKKEDPPKVQRPEQSHVHAHVAAPTRGCLGCRRRGLFRRVFFRRR